MQKNPNIQTLFDAVAKDLDLEIGNVQNEKQFLERVSAALKQYHDKPIALYGRRAEAMFQFVVSSLGKYRVIVQEDSGSVVAVEADIRPPDYRLVLMNGDQFFVEVKNCHLTSFDKVLTIKKEYADSLLRYASLFSQDVKIAVYWSGINIWTLVSLSRFTVAGEKLTLSFLEAAKRNEMALLGDMNVGTTSPLTMRFNTDPDKPRYVDNEGEAQFIVKSIDFYAGGTQVLNKSERNLCYYFMLFSKWPSADPFAIVEESNLVAVEFRCAPEEQVENQGFDFLGTLSTMIANHYNSLTAPQGLVQKLSPSRDPSSLGILIPDDYKGEQLKLWRMVQQPSYE